MVTPMIVGLERIIKNRSPEVRRKVKVVILFHGLYVF